MTQLTFTFGILEITMLATLTTFTSKIAQTFTLSGN